MAPRPRSRGKLAERVQAVGISLVSKAWPNFVGVHMVWGAINELTAVVAYKRLAAMAGHPILSELLARIVRDESRHFGFYFQQAEQRLASPRVARVARLLVDRFWGPVGSGVQPPEETQFLARYLFSGSDGLCAARKVDDTIRRLPGFSDARSLERWLSRHAAAGRRRVPSAHAGQLSAVQLSATARPADAVVGEGTRRGLEPACPHAAAG